MLEFMEECFIASPEQRAPAAAPVIVEPPVASLQSVAASAAVEAWPPADRATDEAGEPAGQGRDLVADSAPAPASPSLTQAWREILAAREEVDRLVSRVSTLATGAIGYSLSLLPGLRVIGDTEDLAKQFREGLFYRASREFGVEGVELKIEQLPILKALGPKALWHEDSVHPPVRGRYRNLQKEERLRRLLEDFDPDLIWAELQSRYGGDAGMQQAYRQVAAQLVVELGLERRPPVERAGRLVLEARTYTEAKWGGGYAYSYSSCDSLNSLRRNLAQFARWAGDADTADQLQHKKVPQLDSNVPLEPRSKQQFGAAMEWTFYKPKTEVALSGDLARSFRIFMAKFGPRPGA